jgi:uncharacterized protein
MKRLIVDTNGLLRVLLDDIPSQKKVVDQLFQRAKNKEIYLLIPEIVIFEVEFSLNKYYSIPKNKIVEKLQIIMAINFIQIASRHIFTTALGHYSNQKLSFVDCFLRAKSNIEEYELFTFDKKLSKLS